MTPKIDETHPLVLGSGSPRRREILANLGVPHVVRKADADESRLSAEAPEAYLERVVAAKLMAVCAGDAGGAGGASGATDGLASVVLVADTVVLDGDAIIGKPSSRDEAEALIVRLSGRTHEVRTRFALALALETPGAVPSILHAETVATRVVFRVVSAAEARAYADGGEGHDKAGGYAIQGRGAGFVSRIEGSYSAVVGLPACELVVALARLGLR